MNDKVLSVKSQADLVEQTRITVYSIFMASLAYTGGIQVTPTITKTPQQVHESSGIANVTLLTLSGKINTVWNNIQNLTENIRASNGSVQGLLDQVNAAMVVLQEAKSLRIKADSLVQGRSFTEEYENNTDRLNTLIWLLERFADTAKNVDNILTEAEDTMITANNTANTARETMSSKQEDTLQLYQESQVTLYNVSEAQRYAAIAQSTVNNYLVNYYDNRNLPPSLVHPVCLVSSRKQRRVVRGR